MSSSRRRRYHVSECLELSASTQELSTPKGPKATSSKSLREKKPRSHSFSRKRLSSLFHTISCGSGLDKSHPLVSLESYRQLDRNDLESPEGPSSILDIST